MFTQSEGTVLEKKESSLKLIPVMEGQDILQEPHPSARQGQRPRAAKAPQSPARGRVYKPGPQAQQGGPRREAQPPARDAAPRKNAAPRQSAVDRGRLQRAMRRARRRRELITFLVMAVLAAGLLAIALVAFLAGRGSGDDSSFAVIAVVSSSSRPEAPSSTASISKPPEPLGPYDEAEPPPLFNYDNYITDDYLESLELDGIGGGQEMARRAAEAFNAMYAAAQADGVALNPVSGYRSNQRQQNNYNSSIQNYLAQGYSQSEAESLTNGYYAKPGTSEHEAGLAVDIGWIEESFKDSEAFAWLDAHAAEYGFILRYRAETFETTRIHYEPWHYRYIGANHAARYLAEGCTALEDYVALLLTENMG